VGAGALHGVALEGLDFAMDVEAADARPTIQAPTGHHAPCSPPHSTGASTSHGPLEADQLQLKFALARDLRYLQ